MSKIDKQVTDKYFESLRPDIERLIRNVDSNPHACIVGVVFSQNPPCMAHISSIENRGEELIRIYLVLSTLVAEMQDNENPRIPFKEFSAGRAPVGQAPEEIGDELAKMVLVTGMDELHVDKVLQLAQNYIMARRPNANKND